MAELPFVSPVVTISEAGPVRQIGLRLRPPFPAYLAGLPMPLVPNRAAVMRAVRVLWLGPDEWLVTADGDAPDLLPRLVRAAGRRRTSVTDLSAGRVILEIAGSSARALVAAGCGLDLHPRTFAPGHCAQTLLARVPVILDQLDDTPRFRLLVCRSYARWLADCLIDAAQSLEC